MDQPSTGTINLMIQEIRVASNHNTDPAGENVQQEIERTIGLDGIEAVRTARVYRVQGASEAEAQILAKELFSDPINQRYTVNAPIAPATASHVIETAYRPGVMNPESASIVKAASDLGIHLDAADSSTEYAFFGRDIKSAHIEHIVGRLLMNKEVERIVTEKPSSLTFEGRVGPITTIPITEASTTELVELSKSRKLFLNTEAMETAQRYFKSLNREPTDGEIETLAARWSEHCGHPTFKAKVMLRQEDGSYIEKLPLMKRIVTAATAQANFEKLVVSAFEDNSGVMRFYDNMAICGKVETHNSPSALEPYGGAMTGSGGVFRDIAGTGQGAKVIISTDMFGFASADTNSNLLPAGTLHPRYLQQQVIRGVRDYGNRMGIPTANGSVHYDFDFRAKPTVMVGAYGILPESRAKKGSPQTGDLIVTVGGRTGRDGVHGATFSSGEMTATTVNEHSSAVQIGNAIEEKRMFDALLEARDLDCIRALTDCGAAGFCSAIGEMGEGIGVHVDISKAPLKYPGLAPWEIWLSESQERMVAAIPPDKLEEFTAVCQKYNVESTILGEFDGSHNLTVDYEDANLVSLDYQFLIEGLPQRSMPAFWQREFVAETRPLMPKNEQEWIDRLKAVLAHGNVCSKEPITRQYDIGVGGDNIIPPFGGITQHGPNDALVIRPILNKPYGIVQSHGMNPTLNRIDPYEGTVWAITEASANYISAGGDITEACGVGNYVWPFPDEAAMGSIDSSVDAAVDMMNLLGLPVISGKDSLSSTYRHGDEVINIPPVYTMSIFGRIQDVEKTMTTDIKQPGSTLILVGDISHGMAGSAYYETVKATSNQPPIVNRDTLNQVFGSVQSAIASGKVLACHDVSEGGVITAITEMCFGGDCGAYIEPSDVSMRRMDKFLFNETAGCFVVEVENMQTAEELFSNVSYRRLGKTTEQPSITVQHRDVASGGSVIFSAKLDELKDAWEAPMKAVFN